MSTVFRSPLDSVEFNQRICTQQAREEAMFMLSLALCSLAVLYCYVHATFKVFFFFEPAFWNLVMSRHRSELFCSVAFSLTLPLSAFMEVVRMRVYTVRIHQLLFTIIPDKVTRFEYSFMIFQYGVSLPFLLYQITYSLFISWPITLFSGPWWRSRILLQRFRFLIPTLQKH